MFPLKCLNRVATPTRHRYRLVRIGLERAHGARALVLAPRAGDREALRSPDPAFDAAQRLMLPTSLNRGQPSLVVAVLLLSVGAGGART